MYWVKKVFIGRHRKTIHKQSLKSEENNNALLTVLKKKVSSPPDRNK